MISFGEALLDARFLRARQAIAQMNTRDETVGGLAFDLDIRAPQVRRKENYFHGFYVFL